MEVIHVLPLASWARGVVGNISPAVALVVFLRWLPVAVVELCDNWQHLFQRLLNRGQSVGAPSAIVRIPERRSGGDRRGRHDRRERDRAIAVERGCGVDRREGARRLACSSLNATG